MVGVKGTGVGADRRVGGRSPVHDSASFGTLIRQEKRRADRNGEGFSLVVFGCAGRVVVTAAQRSFAERLAAGLRRVDSIGWLDESSIGVILPTTSYDGAKQFAERSLSEENGNGVGRGFRVYAYPWHDLPIGSGEAAVFRSEGGEDAPPPVLPALFCSRMPAWKRALDVVGSITALLLLWPLFVAIAAYIKLVSPGPALFRQQRVGKGGRPFTFYKFRTMRPGNNEALHRAHIVAKLRFNEPLEKLDDKGDPRIIFGGRVIRRACLDELPQFINVLRGEMSLVGPRPCLAYEAAEFLRWHGQRFDVVPGMTGLWQVSGKNKLCLLEMIRLDICYANNMSLLLDLKIILRTIPAIVGMVVDSVRRKLKKAK